MAELKITLNSPVTTVATVQAETQISEVEIKRIVVLPAQNTMRVIVDVGGKEVPFMVNGDNYDTVASHCDVAAIIALFQSQLEAHIASNV